MLAEHSTGPAQATLSQTLTQILAQAMISQTCRALSSTGHVPAAITVMATATATVTPPVTLPVVTMNIQQQS